MSLLWTDGDRHIPCDYRLYDEVEDGLTKNDHFAGHDPGRPCPRLPPRCVLFDGWYSSLENLKLIRSCGWVWLTRLKANRKVRIDHGRGGGRGGRTAIATSGTVVWLPGLRAKSGCSGWSPQTATRRTGRPTTWG